jgi:hypothetical protein
VTKALDNAAIGGKFVRAARAALDRALRGTHAGTRRKSGETGRISATMAQLDAGSARTHGKRFAEARFGSQNRDAKWLPKD